MAPLIQVGENASQAPTGLTAQVVTIIILAIGLIAAFIGFLSERRKHTTSEEKRKRASVELQTAATNLERANVELKRAEADLAVLQRQTEIDQLRRIVQQTPFPLAAVCGAVLCLEHSHTIEQATDHLAKLSVALTRLDYPLSPLNVTYIQSTILAPLIESPAHSARRPPGDKEEMETKVVECYTVLTRCFTRPINDPMRPKVAELYKQQRDQAVEHCKHWFDLKERAHLRKETTRQFLPACLNFTSGDQSLLGLHKEMLSIGEKNPLSSIEEDTVACAIRILDHLTEVPRPLRIELIAHALKITSMQWRPVFRDACKTTIRRVLQERVDRQPRFSPQELSLLLDKVGGIIKSQERELIEDPGREDDYWFLVSMIADLHTLLVPDKPREPRPKIRHIVWGPIVPVKLRSERNPAAFVNGQLINFSVGKGIWLAGAFVTSNETIPEFSAFNWTAITVEIDSPIGPILVKHAAVDGPHGQDTYGNPHRDGKGYRIKFPDLPLEAKDDLRELELQYPITR